MAIDYKSVFPIEKRPLVAQLKLKMSKSACFSTFLISALPPEVGLIFAAYLASILKRQVTQSTAFSNIVGTMWESAVDGTPVF